MWSEWFTRNQPLMTRKPYMVSPGNVKILFLKKFFFIFFLFYSMNLGAEILCVQYKHTILPPSNINLKCLVKKIKKK